MRDLKKQLLPGVPVNIPVNKVDFIFMKSTPAEVEVTINGSTLTMRSGDHIKLARDQKHEVYVTSKSVLPIDVVITVGQGEYKRQIIEGEVTVYNGILGVDGERRADTRVEKPFTLSNYLGVIDPMVQGEAFSVYSGSRKFPGYRGGCNMGDRLVIPGSSLNTIMYFYPESGTFSQPSISGKKYDGVGNELAGSGSPSCYFMWNGELHAVMVNAYSHMIFKYIDGNFHYTGYDFPGGWSGAWAETPTAITQYGKYLFVFGHSTETDSSDRYTYRVNTDDWSVTRHSLGGWINGAAIIEDTIYVLSDDHDEVIRSYDADTLASKGSFTATGKDGLTVSWTYGMMMEYKGHLIVPNTPPNLFATRIYAIEPETRARRFTGDIRFSGGRTGILKALEKSVFDETTADFQLEEVGGRLTAKGELVKAIIMQSIGECPDDYLDHVYAVEIEGGDAISGGFQSLARMGFEDDFELTFPANVKLTVDQVLRGI